MPLITADLKHDADELRLASAACDWEMIVAEHQVGVEAAVAIFAGIKAEGEALLRQLERFTAPGEQAAYDRAMRDSLDTTDGIQAHDTCGCGEPIALYEGEWMHVYFSKRCERIAALTCMHTCRTCPQRGSGRCSDAGGPRRRTRRV